MPIALISSRQSKLPIIPIIVPKIIKTVIGRLAVVLPKAMMPNTTKCITAVMLNIQNKSLLLTVTAAIRFARSCAVFITYSFFVPSKL